MPDNVARDLNRRTFGPTGAEAAALRDLAERRDRIDAILRRADRLEARGADPARVAELRDNAAQEREDRAERRRYYQRTALIDPDLS